MLAAASGSLATTFARVTSASRHLTAMHNHVTALASVVTALSNAAFGAERAVRAGEGAPAGGSDAVERREIAAVHTKISGGDTHRPSVQCEKCGDRRVRCADSSLGICRCAAGVPGTSSLATPRYPRSLADLVRLLVYIRGRRFGKRPLVHSVTPASCRRPS